MNNTTVAASAQPATVKEWLGLAVLVLPTVLLALDMTVLHLAVPHLSADLKPGSTQLLWILDIYGFMIAGFLMVMGTLGDRIGRRKLLLCGALAFGLVSVLAAFSDSAVMLIFSRALLGIAGATLMPSTLSLIRNMFQQEHERTRAISIWMTGFIVGGAIGPVVGGLLLEFFWWGSVFLLGVPVMLLLLVLGHWLLPEFRDDHAGQLDIGSALLSVAAILLLVYGLKDMARNSFSVQALMAIMGGLLLGMLFVRRQKMLNEPMLDLNLFRNRLFSTSVLALMLTIMAMSGAWLMVYQFLQGVLLFSPLQSGLVMLPAALLQIIAAQFVPALIQRWPLSGLICAGLLLAVPGFLLMGLAGQVADHGALLLAGGSVLMGVGVMPMMILGTDLVVGSVPVEKAGVASAISETASELGMALGVALIGSVGALVYQQHMRQALYEQLPAEQLTIAADTLGGALSVAKASSSGSAVLLLQSAQAAFSSALWVNAVLGAALVLLVALVIALFLRQKPSVAALL